MTPVAVRPCCAIAPARCRTMVPCGAKTYGTQVYTPLRYIHHTQKNGTRRRHKHACMQTMDCKTMHASRRNNKSTNRARQRVYIYTHSTLSHTEKQNTKTRPCMHASGHKKSVDNGKKKNATRQDRVHDKKYKNNNETSACVAACLRLQTKKQGFSFSSSVSRRDN